MKKLKLQIQISVDGYIAGPYGEMDWMSMNWDAELNEYVTQLTNPVDCILLGRKLAEGFIPHWASSATGEDAYAIAKMNDTPKVVFSKTLRASKWKNTVVANGDLSAEIKRLKQAPGGDMIVYGGGTLVSALIRSSLIDQLHLLVNPVALGSGMKIFTQTTNLELVNSTRFACGITALRYKPKTE